MYIFQTDFHFCMADSYCQKKNTTLYIYLFFKYSSVFHFHFSYPSSPHILVSLLPLHPLHLCVNYISAPAHSSPPPSPSIRQLLPHAQQLLQQLYHSLPPHSLMLQPPPPPHRGPKPVLSTFCSDASHACTVPTNRLPTNCHALGIKKHYL